MSKPGFTLVELLIVLALIGILSSIAYPLYNEHLTRVRRTNAMTALMDLAGRMEEYYIANNTYDGATTEKVRFSNTNKHYHIEMVDTSYLLRATPLGKQAVSDALCGSLMFDQNGNRRISGSGSVAECWR